MWVVTLNLKPCHSWLWLCDDYVLVNSQNTESVIDAVRSGAISENDIDEVITVWQYTTYIVESYIDWKEVTVKIDGKNYSVYIYCSESHVDYFTDEFNFLPDYCIDASPSDSEVGYGCCGDTDSDYEEWGRYYE